MTIIDRNLSGQTFGRLVTVEKITKSRKPYWICRCECGRDAIVSQSSLLNGRTRSCGCLRTDMLVERSTKHGCARTENKTSEYKIWADMRKRCSNPNADNSNYYLGRGITFDHRWNDFGAFMTDMGTRPSPKHSLDRINNDKGYSKDNCRWATAEVQARNTRRNRLYVHAGRSMTAAEWAEEFSVPAARLRHFLSKGEAMENAVRLTRECRGRGRHRIIDWNGQRKTVSEWALATGLSATAITTRLRNGDTGDALFRAPRYKTGRYQPKVEAEQ